MNLLEGSRCFNCRGSCLKMLTKEPDTTPVVLTEEKPLPSKRDRKFDDRKRGAMILIIAREHR